MTDGWQVLRIPYAGWGSFSRTNYLGNTKNSQAPPPPSLAQSVHAFCTVLHTATYALPLTRNQRNGIHARCAEALAPPPQLGMGSPEGRYLRSRSCTPSLSSPKRETSVPSVMAVRPFGIVHPPGNLTTRCRGVEMSHSLVPNR